MTTSHANAFSVVTYNVLAQAYVRPDRYPHSPPEALDPGKRRGRLLDRIAELDADLLCLQEVEPEAHAAIAERLGDRYRGRYAPRKHRPDGCSVFARRRALSWEHDEILRYAAHDPGDDQLALVVHLRRDDRPLVAVSTHLRWQPRRTPSAEHIGRRQLLELIEHRNRAGSPEVPWIVAGDLNANSQSSVLAAAEAHGLRLSCREQRPWDTTNIGGRRRKIDYLLLAGPELTPYPRPLPRLERDTPMPSSTEPSDHLALQVDYTIGVSDEPRGS